MFAALIGLAIGVGILALLVGVIVLIVTMVRNKDGANKLDMKTLLRFYLYLISFVTLMVAAFGAIPAVKSGLSYPLGYQFSYPLETYNEPSPVYDNGFSKPYIDPYYSNREVLVVDGQKYYVDYSRRTKDMVNGLTIVVSMLILFAIHRVALLFIEPKSEGFTGVKKFYTFLSLTVYSLLGIIAVPATIYNIVNYMMLDSDALGRYGRDIPGESLASAIVLVPLWITFLIEVVVLYRKHHTETAK
jgi:hypothetical protein